MWIQMKKVCRLILWIKGKRTQLHCLHCSVVVAGAFFLFQNKMSFHFFEVAVVRLSVVCACAFEYTYACVPISLLNQNIWINNESQLYGFIAKRRNRSADRERRRWWIKYKPKKKVKIIGRCHSPWSESLVFERILSAMDARREKWPKLYLDCDQSKSEVFVTVVLPVARKTFNTVLGA